MNAPLKIVVLGATGMAGSRIADEAVARGHAVTAVARHHDAQAPARHGLNRVTADVAALDLPFDGADAVVSALPARAVLPLLPALVARAAGRRLLFVGGAGSLRLPNGERVIDQPGFREEWKPEASAHVDLLDALRALPDDVDWTFLSPSALFLPGERTGTFRLGADDLLAEADGTSRISAEDYAVALLDEIESPAHRRQRFTVGY
ncbi:NAD-dependent epimerase/dehydratase family protein [Streptomyces klenkii]|uniref:NAD-dependent epimerase/dehydratase family protein n=1 Tax=Streptomyces klenkii TaxID=1420899 RepID=A0A3B0BVK0_9ACTN|nr:NAD(P)H-binding protein [Streptomyces klenkii]RKN76461.1 NAD-dependent epimerase/dehydratase family protein [Streptomyces klenkii]